ncbi:hypothetical protein BDV19DRAFT_389410 [Aspergillus venezuelensis]
MGPQPKMPKATGVQGYPTAGESASYSGLYSFACNYKGCIEGVCGIVEVSLTMPTVSPFTPDTCTAGSGEGSFSGLCSYACNVGYCPIHNCTCTATGPLNVPAAANTSIAALSTVGADSELCSFACERGYCPSPTCVSNEDIMPSCQNGDGTDPECAIPTVCDFSKVFSTLAELEAASDELEPACIDFYTLDGLATVLSQTLDNYTDITSNYDSKFDDYVKYVKEMIPLQLSDFMSPDYPYGPGNQFFHCTYSQNGNNHTTGSYPGDIGIESGTYTAYYELVDADGFYDKLSADYGIDKAWVRLGQNELDLICTPAMFETGCLTLHRTYEGYPLKAAESAINVANPKDIMDAALPNIQNLTSSIFAAQMELALGSWPGATDDVAQSLSMPVSLLSQAVTNMETVVDVAEEYEAAKKKEMINETLMGVLLVVPFLGELTAVADVFAGMSRIISLIGDVGMGAATVYAIVEEPKMASLTILETLLFSGMRDPNGFSTMGKARRGMSKDEVKALGTKFKGLNDQFQSIVIKCRVSS